MNRCSQRMGVYDFKIYILICYYYRNCFVFYCSMRVFQISQITAKKICNSLCLLQWMNTITGILRMCVYTITALSDLRFYVPSLDRGRRNKRTPLIYPPSLRADPNSRKRISI